MKKKRVVSRTLILLLLTIFGLIQTELCQAGAMGDQRNNPYGGGNSNNQIFGTWDGVVISSGDNIKMPVRVSYSPQGTWQSQMAVPPSKGGGSGMLVTSGSFTFTGQNQITTRATQSQICTSGVPCVPLSVNGADVPMNFEFKSSNQMILGGDAFYRAQ